MKWKVRRSRLCGATTPPPSKSHMIRAVLVAALAPGTSTIRNPLLGADGESALEAATALGAEIGRTGAAITIKGIGGRYEGGKYNFDCGNSGTTMRLFAAAAALGSRPRRFDGDASLRNRPMRPLLDALRDLGASYCCEEKGRDVPFVVTGPLRGGSTVVSGITSQFLSSLLISSPLAGADTTITVEDLHERPYVELTLWWLRKSGVEHDVLPDFTVFSVKGGQTHAPIQMGIPGDFSSATFGAVGAALNGSSVTFSGLDFSDPQGDKKIFDILAQFGARVAYSEVGVTVSDAGTLEGKEIDLKAMPDALPALAVLGTAAEGVTHLCNIAQARIKETDRITVMTRELRKMGALITEESDGLIIEKSRLCGAHLDGHHDHRIVMALALAGMIARGETIIATAESAGVTYPSFVQDFRALGAEIEVID